MSVAPKLSCHYEEFQPPLGFQACRNRWQGTLGVSYRLRAAIPIVDPREQLSTYSWHEVLCPDLVCHLVLLLENKYPILGSRLSHEITPILVKGRYACIKLYIRHSIHLHFSLSYLSTSHIFLSKHDYVCRSLLGTHEKDLKMYLNWKCIKSIKHVDVQPLQS